MCLHTPWSNLLLQRWSLCDPGDPSGTSGGTIGRWPRAIRLILRHISMITPATRSGVAQFPSTAETLKTSNPIALNKKGTLLGGSSQDGRKWLITMVIVSPLSMVGPLPNGLSMFSSIPGGVISPYDGGPTRSLHLFLIGWAGLGPLAVRTRSS